MRHETIESQLYKTSNYEEQRKAPKKGIGTNLNA